MNSDLRILLADDDEIVREHLSSLLSHQEGFKVISSVKNGAEAIGYLGSSEVNVVLDVDMPILNGIEAAKVISHLFPHVTIIMLTCFAQKESLADSIELGIKGFLTKDTPIEQLANQIKDIYEGRTIFSDRPLHAMEQAYIEKMHAAENYDAFVSAVSAMPKRLKPVFNLMAQGLSNKAIAHTLGLSVSSVRTYASDILLLTECESRGQLAIAAIKSGIDLEDI